MTSHFRVPQRINITLPPTAHCSSAHAPPHPLGPRVIYMSPTSPFSLGASWFLREQLRIFLEAVRRTRIAPCGALYTFRALAANSASASPGASANAVPSESTYGDMVLNERGRAKERRRCAGAHCRMHSGAVLSRSATPTDISRRDIAQRRRRRCTHHLEARDAAAALAGPRSVSGHGCHRAVRTGLTRWER